MLGLLRPYIDVAMTKPLRNLPSLMRVALVVALTFGLAFPLAPLAAAQTATSPTAELSRLFDGLAAPLDRTAFDLDELSLELAFEDAEGITAWVAESIRYQTYRGLLRGPAGTLVASAGNALDQAVLLARLIGDAGYDVRVALGNLPSEHARTLVMRMFETDAPTTAGKSVAEVTELLAQVSGVTDPAALSGLQTVVDTPLQELPTYQRALTLRDELLLTLGQPDPSPVTDELIAEAGEYAWVEYRLGESDTWSAAHPLFSAGQAPTVEAEEYLEGTVPERLQHRLRVEVSIERKRGDEFVVESIMTPWERPIANLLGVPLSVGNTVLGDVSGATLDESVDQIAEAGFFAPTLNGSLAPGAQAFDLNGHLVPPDVGANAMAGVFQSVGNAMGNAIGALGGMGSDDPLGEPFALTAQYLDFVLVAPGGEETVHRRVLFDRRTPEARASGSQELLPQTIALDGVITMYTVMATGGSLSGGYVADQLRTTADHHLAVLDELSATQAQGADEEGMDLLEAMAGYVPNDHLRLFPAFDAASGTLDGIAYRAEPSLLGLYGVLRVGTDGESRSGVDIIANSRRALVLDQGSAEIHGDFSGAVLLGAWETVVETEFVASYGGEVRSAATAPAAAEWRVLRAAEAGALDRSQVPATVASAVLGELANGYDVALPLGSDGELTAANYWRVDPLTGETLGMSADGRGNAMTEFLVNLTVGLVVNAALAVPSLIMCAQSGGGALCYCDVIASGVALSLVGALLGALIAAEAMLYYAIVDIGVIAPVTTIVTPPMCSGWATSPRPGGEQLAAAGGSCWSAG